MQHDIFLSIVYVNFNSKLMLLESIKSIFNSKPSFPFEILVIDNHSKDNSCEIIKTLNSPLIKLHINKKPMGYTLAANKGFSLSKGNLVLLLNPDMKVTDGTIDNLIKHLQADPTIGAVGGYLLNPDGSFNHYYNDFPTIFSCYLSSFFPKKLACKFKTYQKYHMLNTDFNYPVEVPQPAACCFLFRKNIFKNHFMDSAFTIYFSDVDICKKIYNCGYKIMVYPDCKAFHCHDYSSRDGWSSAKLYYADYFIGMSNFFKIYHGKISFGIIKILFGSTLLFSFFISLIKFFTSNSHSLDEVLGKFYVFTHFIFNRNSILMKL